MRAAPKRIARSVRGFTLIELMVALVLGLLMIGAVIIVFISNQQTAQTKQELDRAQEAFRFASHTIMRVVQQGIAIEEPPSSLPNRPNAVVLLVVRMNPPPPAPARSDCFGRPIPTDPDIDYVDIAFIREGDALRCRVVTVLLSGATPDPVEETLVSDLAPARTEFLFGVGNQSVGFWFDNERWVPSNHATLVGNWHNVRSVRVRLAMQAEEGGAAIGPMAVFSATMRSGALDSNLR